MSNVTTQDLIDDGEGLEGYRRYCRHVEGSMGGRVEKVVVDWIRTIRYRGAEFTCSYLSQKVRIYRSWRTNSLIRKYGTDRAIHEEAKRTINYQERNIRFPYAEGYYSRRTVSQIGLIHDRISGMGKRTGEYFYPIDVKVVEFKKIKPYSICCLCGERKGIKSIGDDRGRVFNVCECCYVLVSISTPSERQEFIKVNLAKPKYQLSSSVAIPLIEVDTSELRRK